VVAKELFLRVFRRNAYFLVRFDRNTQTFGKKLGITPVLAFRLWKGDIDGEKTTFSAL
jgi:hypothetical protein